MNPRIKLIPSSVRALIHGEWSWLCVSAGSFGLGNSPFEAYAAWYRARIKAMVR